MVQLNNEDRSAQPERWTLSMLLQALSPLRAGGDRELTVRRVAELLVSTVATVCEIDLAGSHSRPIRVRRGRGRTGAIVFAGPPEASDAGGVSSPACGDPGRGNLVVVPLTVDQATIGTLKLRLDSDAGHLDDSDLADLARLGLLLAAFWTGAETGEQESQAAQKFQEWLTPKRLARGDWFSLAGRYEPGTAGLDMGGDWYDADLLDDGMLALSIGDVAGHGIEAAIRMGELRSAMLALRLVRRAPDDLMGTLHRLAETAGFATALCARLDRQGNLVWSSAGHLPPLLLHVNGGVETLADEQSPPLGVGYRRPIPLQRRKLETGDMLLLYTDGLIERRRQPIDISIAELAKRFAGAAGQDPEDFIDELLERRDLQDSTGDDVALLAMRYQPPAV